MVAPNKGKGKSYAFLAALLGHQDDACVTWPFCRDKHGRGMLAYDGWHGWAHRKMCEMAHGAPPTPKHTAAHLCGKGHEGCVNPRHLAWKTQKENLADCQEHGTQIRHRGGNVRRLSPDQIQDIKLARGRLTQGQLAARYGVSEGTISDIWHGRSHTRPSKISHWTPEQLAKLTWGRQKGLRGEPLAALVGKTIGAIQAKEAKLRAAQRRL